MNENILFQIFIVKNRTIKIVLNLKYEFKNIGRAGLEAWLNIMLRSLLG